MAWPIARHINDVDQRRADRDEIGAFVHVRRRSPPISPPCPAILINLSPLGFLVRTDMEAIDGSLVSIELPLLGEVKARSIWSMEQNLGAEFLQPIGAGIYQNILAVIERRREALAQPDRSNSTPESRSNR